VPTIRFHFPDGAAAQVRVAYQPLLETLFSLSVLAEPQRYPLRHPWVRQMRRSLPPALRREIAACSFALGKTSATGQSWLPNPLGAFPAQTGDSGSFAATMRAFTNLADDTVLRSLETLAALDDNGHSAEARAALAAARGDPVAFWRRLCDLITTYWDTAFAAEWERIEPVLSDSAAEASRVLAADGITALGASLGPRVHVGRTRRGIRLDLWLCRPRETTGDTLDPADADVEIEDTFALVPSTFTWPRVWFNIEPPGVGITFAAPSVLRDARLPPPPNAIVLLLRACADEVRLHALRWIAEEPRSTQELASLIGITDAGMSKHLHVLSEAGLVETDRQGRYVLYRLRDGNLKTVVTELARYLQVDEAPARSGPIRSTG
jgi:DNA-binding transcriptional ArsR family regulator